MLHPLDSRHSTPHVRIYRKPRPALWPPSPPGSHRSSTATLARSLPGARRQHAWLTDSGRRPLRHLLSDHLRPDKPPSRLAALFLSTLPLPLTSFFAPFVSLDSARPISRSNQHRCPALSSATPGDLGRLGASPPSSPTSPCSGASGAGGNDKQTVQTGRDGWCPIVVRANDLAGITGDPLSSELHSCQCRSSAIECVDVQADPQERPPRLRHRPRCLHRLRYLRRLHRPQEEPPLGALRIVYG